MHISILLCMLIMVHRKMLIEKIDCINKSTDLLLRLRKDYCCSQKEKNGNLGKVLKLKVRLNKVSDLDYIQILAFKVVKIILFQTVSYYLCQLIPEATWWWVSEIFKLKTPWVSWWRHIPSKWNILDDLCIVCTHFSQIHADIFCIFGNFALSSRI